MRKDFSSNSGEYADGKLHYFFTFFFFDKHFLHISSSKLLLLV